MYSKVNTALDVSTYPHSSWSHQVSKNHGIICLLWRNLYIYIDKHTFTASLSCSTRGGFDIVPWSLHLCGNPWFPNTWIATVLSPRASLRMLVHWGAVVYTFALVIYDDRYFELVGFFGDLYISLVDLWSMILYISWSISMYYVYIYIWIYDDPWCFFWHSHDSEGLTVNTQTNQPHVSRYDVSVVQGFDLGPGSPGVSVRFLVVSLGLPSLPDKSPVVNGYKWWTKSP